MKRYLIGLVVLALAGVGLLASCSKEDQSFNQADVTFTQGMIPHHTQAVEMAKVAGTRAGSAKVKDLARRIEAAQGPEIKQMKSWLKQWDKPESGSDHSSMSMDGMMTDGEMADLRRAQGTDFDKQFLTMMTSHHKGAVAMARTEVKDGKDSDAKELARGIIATQEREINEMARLRRDL